MLYLDGIVGLALLALWVFCIVDVITAPDGSCRHLPKMLWLIIVILLPEIGSLVWLAFGRPVGAQRSSKTGFYAGAESNGFPEYERLGRATSDSAENDAEFLRLCRERAAEQRRRYEERQRDDQA